jgi:magnesium transporter
LQQKALNLYNAALVTPTYYVYFTSCTIISSAVLYQGFKGTTIQILTVVLGFLQICSGVVLLQLSKSAKDVPDAAVFAGDLDQVRTVAEQEEPEYEPRADSMRGTAALLRSLSTKRQKRETKEVARIREEHLQSINETDDGTVEWDGLRRRRTISSPESPGLQRRKTIHPPLGMSHFPNDEDLEDEDGGMHPGFWSHFRRKPVSSTNLDDVDMESGALPLGPIRPRPESGDSLPAQGHTLGLPTSLRNMGDSPTIPETDTTYHGAGDAHVQWSASAPHLSPSTTTTQSPSIRPVGGSPGQETRRQFSFHSVFNRNRSPSGAATAGSQSPGGTAQPSSLSQTHYPYASNDALQAPPVPSAPVRPLTARSGLSFARRASGPHRESNAGTEEERLGLVRGVTRDADPDNEGLPGYESPISSDGTRSPEARRGPPGYDAPGRRDGDGGAGAGAGAGAGTGSGSASDKELEAASGRAFV